MARKSITVTLKSRDGAAAGQIKWIFTAGLNSMRVLSVLAIAAGIFLLTHLDTFLVLLVFGTSPGYQPPEIVIGHFLSTGFGLGASVVGSVIATELLHDYAFLLGVLPLVLGMRGLYKRRETSQPLKIVQNMSRRHRIGNVTFAGIGLNGGNIAIFVPFFAGLTVVELAIVSALYVVGAGLVVAVALLISLRTAAIAIPEWVETVLVPVALIFVGLYVFGAGWVAA